MKKINIIKSNEEYNRIIKNIKPYKTKAFLIFIEKKEQEKYKFGFSISKKIGKAVIRNKIKRQLKNILDQNNYENNFNCIIMVRKGFFDLNFIEIANSLNDVLIKFNVIKENKCAKKYNKSNNIDINGI